MNVGGDFMGGRFLSHAYLVVGLSLATLVSQATPAMRRRVVAVAMAVCAVYWFAWPHTPVNSPLTHRASVPDENGFADERGVYNYASLYRYLTRENPVLFPDHKWSRDGLTLRNSPVCCTFAWSMGFYGYWAGTEKRIVDMFAICDPLLARLPVTDTDWRIGHYPRRLPEGYLATVHHGTNHITDPEMREFYEIVRLVTQSDRLFSPERLRAIVAFNFPR
jgi:arabinofuranosyltransferase